MPTARELLEEADALMRRNRAAALDDIPVLTDVMPAVPMPKEAHTAPVRDDAGPLSVPLLTENIDVVDFADDDPPITGADAIEGEPSIWLEFEDSEPSVIGDAPDSIAIVPPVAMRPPQPDEALLASAEHEEIELTQLVEETPIAAIVADTIPPSAQPIVDDEPRVEVSAEMPMADADGRAPFAPVAAAMPQVPVVSVAPPTMANDDERWVSVAEEIRMQVLQRIDLFTDTGLRDQLAQRLQPIADRASADFVAAINVHVGELLRTYVAEAIEREIERWRRDH